jgi:hypothetical protein
MEGNGTLASNRCAMLTPSAPIRWLFAAVLCAAATAAHCQTDDRPRTRAERTDYAETSSYDDVMQFLAELQRKGAPVRVETIGKSDQGRDIPLVILSRPLVKNAAEARRLNRPVVYLQANIHAGEVEGKEAVLALLRDLSSERKGLADKLVILATPIYNIDGNEAWGEGRVNRSHQNGPARIGRRENGKGYDLNRDAVKAETPEMRALLQHVFTAWEPDLMMDLHTTDGTRHGYQLTYAPQLNPNTEPQVLRFTVDELLPTIRKKLAAKGIATQNYGNVEGPGANRAWRTVGEEPRYVTNYVGFRNRIALLSEAASFLPFKTRIDATRAFVDAVLDETARQSRRILSLTHGADKRVTEEGKRGGTELGVRFAMEKRGSEPVPLEKLPPGAAVDHMAAPLAFELIDLPIYDRFVPTKTATLPRAYIIPGAETGIVELLRRHGIVVDELREELRGPLQRFVVTQRVESPSAFQGHRMVRLEGHFEEAAGGALPGAYLVRTAQPLGRLIFALLEPESLDGVAAWGLLKQPVQEGGVYPILKQT